MWLRVIGYHSGLGSSKCCFCPLNTGRTAISEQFSSVIKPLIEPAVLEDPVTLIICYGNKDTNHRE